MIIAKSPLRISLGGGGTDLESFYSNHGGFFVAAAIDKYVYVTITKPFSNGIYLKYSKQEAVDMVDEIEHPIIKAVLMQKRFNERQIEITTLADIPSGTGLGSSGSFTTALIKALSGHFRDPIHQNELAELACSIEIDILKQPIGKQDQYIAAYGGLSAFTISKDGAVNARSVGISNDKLFELEENLSLYFTGITRSAGAVLADQKVKTEANNEEMLRNLKAVKAIGKESESLLRAGDFKGFATLMDQHWQTKKLRSEGISNSYINDLYDYGLMNGALGGKLVGAGGGGFLLFYSEDSTRLRQAMQNKGLDEVRFKFDFEGTRLISL